LKVILVIKQVALNVRADHVIEGYDTYYTDRIVAVYDESHYSYGDLRKKHKGCKFRTMKVRP